MHNTAAYAWLLLSTSGAGDAHICIGQLSLRPLPAVVAFDAYKSRNRSEIRVASGRPSAGSESRRRVHAAAREAAPRCGRLSPLFLARYSRSLIETSSAYVVMPCTFVFVLNAQPSAFAQRRLLRPRHDRHAARHGAAVASACDPPACGAADVGRPEAAVCQQRVQLLDCRRSQRVLRRRGTCAPISAAVRVQTLCRSALCWRCLCRSSSPRPSFSSSGHPEQSTSDNVDWPWASTSSHNSSTVFSFDETRVAPRLRLPQEILVGLRRSLVQKSSC